MITTVIVIVVAVLKVDSADSQYHDHAPDL